MGNFRDLARGLRRAASELRREVRGSLVMIAAREVQRDNMRQLDRQRNAAGTPLVANTSAWTAFKSKHGFSSKKGRMTGAMRSALGSRAAITRTSEGASFGVPKAAKGFRGRTISLYAGSYSRLKAGGKLLGVNRVTSKKLIKRLRRRLVRRLERSITIAL